MEGSRNIDEALIGRSSEEKIWIFQLFDEGTVDEDINEAEQFTLVFLNEALESKPCVAPDVFVCIVVYGTGELSKTCSLIHGIATRESDVGKRVGHDNLHNLGGGHLMATAEVPRLGVMTAGALMAATRTIDGGPESRTIHHCIFKYIQYSNHYSLFTKKILHAMIDVRHAVVELGEFTRVPTVSCAYEITRDALESVDVGATAFRTFFQVVIGILVAAVHTTVAVVVYRAIAHIELVHHIHDTHDNLWVVRSIAVDLDIEDMTTASEDVIRSLDFGLMASTTFIIDRYVVGVGIIVAIRNTRNDTELLAVFLGELTTQTLGRRGQN